MPTVTVIIPVYKVERYLDACVESVVRQSYADLEILLVDDGSPDRCPALCDAWAEKDPRIKVIHRENGGLSAARNSGIDAAMGEFLLFVDSDDLLEPDAVRRAVDAQRQQDADLVIFNLTYVDEENRPLPQPDFSGFTDEILDEDGVWQRCFALAETRIYYVVAWNKLYRRSLFQHLRYAPGKRYEDQFLLPHLLAQCKTIACLAAPGYRYVLGSVLNQVLLHQSVIGLETKTALDKYGVVPDIIIGCAGGGSNLGGLISPFMGEKLRGERDYRFIAVEPASCPSLTRGRFAYDFCDTGKVCPLAKMYTLGSGFIPSPNHAGGLRYHGMSSIVSQLYHDGYMEARSVEQTKVFEAAEQFARIEGILPAPESSHAIRVAIDEAVKCRETGEAKTIVFGLTGTGYFDMVAYEKFHNGEMSDFIPSDAQLAESFATLPQVPGLDD